MGEAARNVSNLEIHPDHVLVHVSTRIYPKDIVYYAAYVFLDRAFVVLDGNPEDIISVELRPKQKSKDLEELGRDFNNELLNYAVYKFQLEKNRYVRDAILKQALEGLAEPEVRIEDDCIDEMKPEISNDATYEDDPLGIAKPWEESNSKEMSYVDDPLGIAKPWEETHGKENQ
jgi:His-Xaa-Ser system protein HxsD